VPVNKTRGDNLLFSAEVRRLFSRETQYATRSLTRELGRDQDRPAFTLRYVSLMRRILASTFSTKSLAPPTSMYVPGNCVRMVLKALAGSTCTILGVVSDPVGQAPEHLLSLSQREFSESN